MTLFSNLNQISTKYFNKAYKIGFQKISITYNNPEEHKLIPKKSQEKNKTQKEKYD
jgi:hypothetical protein